jgi:hypothetical protein
MKRLIIAISIILCSLGINAQQPVEGSTYFLPKTAVRFSVLVEKTAYTPGELAIYGEKYMKLTDIDYNSSTSYRIVSTTLSSIGTPDSSKQHTAVIDKKHSIISVERDRSGILLAINAKPMIKDAPKSFVAAAKPAPLNARDFMTEDILAAGSKAKMAELIAQDIYEIRDSRNQLSRGEAEFMPKDGEQLKIMLANLNKQEQALMQVFKGTISKDTIEEVITFIPQKEENKYLLFRFSKNFGFTDKDDLAGNPYYVSVEDEHSMPELKLANEEKKSKDDCGIYVNLPGKIKITLFDGNQQRASFELYAAQFGKEESISGELFGKKFTTHIVLDPVTGNAQQLKTEPLN